MTLFNSFVGTFGLLLLLTTAITSWVFRTSTAPIAAKLVVPTCLVLLACVTPWRVLTIMGYPTPSDMRSLPETAELVAFVANDDKGRVDLWLREGGKEPRAYNVALDPQLKEALEAARDELGHGERVGLRKKGKITGRHGGFFDFDTPAPPYEIDPSAFRLPVKNQ